MAEKPRHIKFNNRQNPNAEFDLIRLEDLFNRADSNAILGELHLVEFYAIILIEEGQGFHTIDFTDYSFKKGTILTVRKDQIHRFSKRKNIKGTHFRSFRFLGV